MNIKIGNRVRFKYDIFKQLGLRGRREIAIVKNIDPFYERCSFENGIHGYQNIHVNNLEKVELKKQHEK